MKFNMLLFLSTFLLLASCANTLHRGIVAMKIDSRTAHVGINKSEVQIGDHVELFGNKCTKKNPAAENGDIKKAQFSCIKVEKGHGQVFEILGDNYVSVKFDEGVSFEEGDFIEKHSH